MLIFSITEETAALDVALPAGCVIFVGSGELDLVRIVSLIARTVETGPAEVDDHQVGADVFNRRATLSDRLGILISERFAQQFLRCASPERGAQGKLENQNRIGANAANQPAD